MLLAGTRRFRCGLLVCVFLVTQAAIAQVSVEGVQFQSLGGQLGFGYDGQFGTQQQSNHDAGINGNLSTNGFYYHPGFLAFQANTYYTRADSSAETTNLTDSKGFTAGAAIFGGSPDPGYVSYAQNWGQSGTYGLAALGTGLNSTNNNRNFAVSWLFKNLPVKNLSVYFGDTVSDVDIPGIGVNSNSATKGFGASTSGYHVLGFAVGAGYQHSSTDSTTNISGADGETIGGTGSSNVFHALASRTLPWNSNLSLSAYRIMSSSSGEGDNSSSDTNEFDASISSRVWRLPISGTISYNDNVFQTVVQQLNAEGQLIYTSEATPKIGELNMSLFSSYSLPHQVFVTGYLSHQEEFLAGENVGSTGYGGTVGYGFGKFLKGLTITVGMHDTATQAGNSGAGLTATASYRRNLGAWRFNANANYSQGVQTLLALTTESSGGANASVRRELPHGISFGANAGFGRSLYSNVPGPETEMKNAGVNFGWMKQSLSVYYADSSGNTIVTNQGLVQNPVPGVGTSMPFSGKSYNAGYANTLIKNTTISLAWSKFTSTGTGTGLFSNISSEQYSGSLAYAYRKLNFTANCVHSEQGASVTTALPSNITVFYVGVSRWFNFF